MSLINPTPSPAAQAVAQMANQVQNAYNAAFNAWRAAVMATWKNPVIGNTPQAIASAMGTDAVNNFTASGDTASYLSSQSKLLFDAATDAKNQAAITAVNAVIGAFTANSDGSVTIAA